MNSLQSIYEVLDSFKTQGFGINNGLMGRAIFTYALFKETKKKEFMESADFMIERIVEEIEKSSSITIRELSEIGWGLSYLIHEGFLEDESNALEKLDSLFRNSLLDNKQDIETVINIALYFFSRFTSNLSRNQIKRSLLLCQRIAVDSFGETTLLGSQLSPNYFTFLAGLFHLNIFRFRIMYLFLDALSALQSVEKDIETSELKRYAFIIKSLFEDKYIRLFLQEQSPPIYEFCLRIMEKAHISIEFSNEYPIINKMDEAVYLISDDWHCILLFSVNHLSL